MKRLILNRKDAKGAKRTRRFLCVLCVFAFLIGGLPIYAQAPVPPPEKVWLSLGYSTLDQRPPDWKWLRSQCEKAKLLTNLQPIRSKVAGLLVPVFDEGMAFYPTSVATFKGRNPGAGEYERALRSLLTETKKVGLPVYLGVDALGWDKTPAPTGKQGNEEEKSSPRGKPPAPISGTVDLVFSPHPNPRPNS